MVRKIFLLTGALVCMLALNPATAHAQPVSLYTAVRNAAAEIYSGLERTSIAVITMGSYSERMSSHLIDEMIIALAGTGGFAVANRSQLDQAARELHFPTSREATEAAAQAVGRLMGVRAVVKGVFEPADNFFRFRIRAIDVETAAILGAYNTNVQNDRFITFLHGGTIIYRPHGTTTPVHRPDAPHTHRLPGEPPFYRPGDAVSIYYVSIEPRIEREDSTRFWSVGVSIGTGFTEPLLIASLQATFAPLRNSFIRVGSDLGFISNTENAGYYSMSVFAHYALFLPFSWGGWHAGVGGSFMIAEYDFEFIAVPRRVLAADVATGINIQNIIDISFVFRTNFSTVFSTRVLVGFTHRFPLRNI